MKFLVQQDVGGLFLDPGLGKTSVVLASFLALIHCKQARRMLVVAPLRVAHLVWPEEVKKWKTFEGLRVEVLHGPKKEERLAKEADIFVINPEGLQWLVANGRLQKLGCDTLVIDESSKFKHTDTARYKLLKRQLNSFTRRWILTGSPAANSLLDLFGQIYILDFGKALGRYVTHYRNEFFEPTGYNGYEWRLKKGAEPLIQERIKRLVMRLKAEDYLTLPDLISINLMVELPPKAAKIYKAMEDEMFHAIDDSRSIAAVSAASVSIKCRQITGGAVYVNVLQEDDDYTTATKREFEEIHDEKIKALADLLEERSGKPTLILYQFQHELARLKRLLGKDVPNLGSGVSERLTKQYCTDWNAGRLPELLGHPASMGHGLNLQDGDGDAIVWFSPTWDYELYDQTIRRLKRQGSKHKKIFVYHILARGTVDEAVFRASIRKGRRQESFLEALKSYRRTSK
jgi:SNF2 family DNA or RNA helicase